MNDYGLDTRLNAMFAHRHYLLILLNYPYTSLAFLFSRP